MWCTSFKGICRTPEQAEQGKGSKRTQNTEYSMALHTEQQILTRLTIFFIYMGIYMGVIYPTIFRGG